MCQIRHHEYIHQLRHIPGSLVDKAPFHQLSLVVLFVWPTNSMLNCTEMCFTFFSYTLANCYITKNISCVRVN